MKKCPYCAEEIQDEAIKCRYCDEMIEESHQPLSPDSSVKSNGKPSSKIKMFLIPTIIVILLPLLTISFVYYQRYYDKYGYHSAQKEEKTNWDAIEKKAEKRERQISTTNKQESISLRNQAENLLREDNPDYVKVLDLLNKSIKMNPNNALAYQHRGDAYITLKDYKNAIQDFNKSIELNLINTHVYNNRGFAYSILGQNQQALEDFNQTIRLDPKYDLAYYNRGCVYGELGKRDRACNDWRKACELGYCKGIKSARKDGYCR